MLFTEELAYLQKYSTFSYSRFTADKNNRTLYKTAAQNPVEFRKTCMITNIRISPYLPEP